MAASVSRQPPCSFLVLKENHEEYHRHSWGVTQFSWMWQLGGSEKILVPTRGAYFGARMVGAQNLD